MMARTAREKSATQLIAKDAKEEHFFSGDAPSTGAGGLAEPLPDVDADAWRHPLPPSFYQGLGYAASDSVKKPYRHNQEVFLVENRLPALVQMV